MSDRIVVVAAKRTPQGRFLGALAEYSALDLAFQAANVSNVQLTGRPQA